MRIPVNCNACGRDFSAPESHIGRKVVCPECGTGVKVRSSAIATPRESDDELPRSGARRARGAGPNPKVIFGIVGIVAAVAAVAVGMKNLPDLSKMNSVVVSPPPPQSAAPGPAASQPDPGAQPAKKPDDLAANSDPPAQTPPAIGLEARRKEIAAKAQAQEEKAARSQPLKRQPQSTSSVRHDRAKAEDEVDTDRGQRLMGKVRTIVLVREGARNDRNFDPRGTINQRVTNRAKSTLEKAGLKVHIASPGPKSAVLKVTLTGKPSPVGARGTQDLTLSGELICFDSKASAGEMPYVSVWKHEESLGTIARQAARSGKITEKLDRNIGDFVNRFRVAWQQAEKAATAAGEEPEDADDSEAMASDESDNAGETTEEEPAMTDDDNPDDAVMEEDDASDQSQSEETEESSATDDKTTDGSRPTKKSTTSK